MEGEYTAVIKHEGEWWIGWIEEVPGVNCHERTHEELLESLQITLQEALELDRPHGTFKELLAALESVGPPDEDFARDLEEIHRSQPALPGDPWASDRDERWGVSRLDR